MILLNYKFLSDLNNNLNSIRWKSKSTRDLKKSLYSIMHANIEYVSGYDISIYWTKTEPKILEFSVMGKKQPTITYAASVVLNAFKIEFPIEIKSKDTSFSNSVHYFDLRRQLKKKR